MRSGSIGLLLLTTLLLSSCAADGDHQGSPPASGPSVSQELSQQRQAILQKYPDAVIPDVKVERLVTLEEKSSVNAQCLSEQGFDSTVTGDGATKTMVGKGQDLAFQIAKYACDARFPIDPKYNAPLTDSQLKLLYRYQTGKLVKCLTAHGYKVDPVPSEQVFIQNYGQPNSWIPYAEVDGSGESWDQINQDCPQVPDSLWGQ